MKRIQNQLITVIRLQHTAFIKYITRHLVFKLFSQTPLYYYDSRNKIPISSMNNSRIDIGIQNYVSQSFN